MPRIKNITNEIFGRLTAISLCKNRSSGGSALWLCKCDCGNRTIVNASSLRNGRTRSCGCLKSEELVNRMTTHGKVGSKIHQCWKDMKQRCLNEKNHAYKDYGGRGILIGDEWLDFQLFYNDMGDVPKGMFIDRIDNDKGYYKENCRWATKETQANNTRRNKHITHNGKMLSYAQWDKSLGGSNGLIKCRIEELGWTEEKAVTTPARQR